MKELVKRLNDQLETLRPDYYQNLKEPLSEKGIEILVEKYQVQIPNDLIELYKWKNGQVYDCYEAFANNSMFMPLEDVLESWEELTSMIGSDFEIENWWNMNWLPIFGNGGGSYICYDLGGLFTGDKGQLIEFWNRDNDRNVIAPNLETFISKIVNYYDNTKEEDFDEYFEIEDIEGFPKEFIVE
ncbi:SMI1/KNR4 family protein [Flavobacterium tistrianum]|uniref:SMI1/KNR4 family protein n=1 Tax=Flavobacterium tistrianum TaxID=1685414 RepID=UPI000DAE9589|nr:SMI1/KNR4 family protein [Flavobacterium tistrianum]KAF2339787.1 family 1 glycosylhydrolase [Flavobacterium tistrianum]